MMYISRALALMVLLIGLNVHAYTAFSLDRSFDWKRESDIFIVGYGKDAGTLFLDTALARAKNQIATFPGRQVLVIWARENGQSRDQEIVSNRGYSILSSNDSELSMNTTVAWLEKMKKISSLHFVGHSSAWYGFGLQPRQRFTQDKNKLTKLKNNFTDGAYIYLHGCNTGFNSAPELSNILELPVLGSLTSTDFQQKHSNGQWFWNNKGQYPEGGWDSRACNGVECFRLKANNHPYTGSWGKYEVGLSFHKAFCNFDLGRSGLFSRKKGIDVCYQGLWNAIKTWPSTSSIREWTDRETYKEVIADFLCPKLDGHSVDKTCRSVLATAERGQVSTQKFYWGDQLECNFNGCNWGVRTQNVTGIGKVQIFTGSDAGNRTIANEYLLYLKLFDLYSR